MKNITRIQRLVFVVIWCFVASYNAFGMFVEKLAFSPVVQPKNPAITRQRRLITTRLYEEGHIKNSTLTQIADAVVVRTATSQEKPWRCLGYAIAHATNGSATPLT